MSERDFDLYKPHGNMSPPWLAMYTEIAELSVSALLPADSPRLSGESEEHIRLLADSGAELPPIIVHRPTMRVVDGMHRLRAAKLRGQGTIKARLIDGAIETAFVVAVQSNISHGLPLSLVDREAAAARILTAHPHWSDRAIANITGISARTVLGIRRSVITGQCPSGRRVGQDGRVRPVNGADGRLRAGELLKRRPNASLREVAREAGISVGTALDVRARIKSGEDPVLPAQRKAEQRKELVQAVPRLRPVESACLPRDRATILHTLWRDPTIRFTDRGRELLRWLEAHAVGTAGWPEVAAAVPLHGGYVIAELAGVIANEWHEFAERLRQSLAAAEDGLDAPRFGERTDLAARRDTTDDLAAGG
jgi:ParB-like chromosome segregation protein Spo0J